MLLFTHNLFNRGQLTICTVRDGGFRVAINTMDDYQTTHTNTLTEAQVIAIGEVALVEMDCIDNCLNHREEVQIAKQAEYIKQCITKLGGVVCA